MATQKKAKDLNMITEDITLKIGRCYEILDDTRPGCIGKLLYKGKTFFNAKYYWYGFEIVTDHKGKNNGTVQGQPYFKTEKPNKGIFKKRDAIGKMVSSKLAGGQKAARKKGALETGRSEYRGGEDFKVEDDDEPLFGERVSKKKKPAKAVAKKQGPREIGRTNYKGGEEYEIKEDEGELFGQRIAKAGEAGTVKKKEGPREIGRTNYKGGEEYEIKEDEGELFGQRLAKAGEAGTVEKKQGPREIGTSDYNPDKTVLQN